MREQLLDTVGDRLREYLETKDTDLVLSEDALAEAEDLMASGGPGDLPVLYTGGLFFWFRSLAFEDPAESLAALEVAALSMEFLFEADPERVPENFRDGFEAVRTGDPASADPVVLWAYGRALLRMFGENSQLATASRAADVLRLGLRALPETDDRRPIVVDDLARAITAVALARD
jgi:hypothetical protein